MGFAPGTRVGDYEVVGSLGYGGMGEVYRVRHVISDRIEAMKLLRAGYAFGPAATELLDRFLREIRLLATLNHPNISTLHTAFRYEQELVMIMECVEGEDLGRRVAAGLTLDESLQYARQTLTGLSHAHEHGIIHRDIKPSNIMITPQGQVKLLDFGLALAGGPGAGLDQRLTTTGALVGSMHYIAPEQISGAPHDARSDIYAVGVTLYEMITGRLPIEGANHLQVIAGHLQHAPAAPHTLNPQVPAALSAAVMHALRKNPRERWESAAAFLEALDSVTLNATSSRGVSQARVRPARPSPGAGERAPSSSGSHRPESLTEITRQLATHVGPVAGVLVRRASGSTTTLRELVDAVAREIDSPTARQTFQQSVHKMLAALGTPRDSV